MDNFSLHLGTPTLAVTDPRGLAVCGVAYRRGASGQAPEARVTRQVFDAAGRGVEQWDPRLLVTALSDRHSLSGKVLATDSVDAGWRVALFGQADEVLSGWDGRGTRHETEYDSLLRPLVVMEQARVVERFEYGTCGPEANPGNQCGRLIRHDDPAGTRHMPEYDLLGMAQSEVSHFLERLEPVDWPLDKSARDALLEPVPGLESRWAHNSLGDLLSLTDAKAHRRHFTYTVAGQLKEGWLQPANTASPGRCLVHDIRYNPGGKVERETAENGVVTEAEYALDDGRLLRFCAGVPNAAPLQDLRYTVDPIGNILQIDDHALPIRYHKNQRVDARCTYSYDTLGQLTHATGWEAERSSNYPGTSYRPSANPNAVVNYREEYDYDAAGNMTELRHLGVQPFTRRWAVAANSNRSLIESDQPPDFDSHFDDNGNLQYLQRGQTMSWDLRNQLSSVSPVVREEEDDTEVYVYGGGGKRLRKVRTALAAAHRVIAEVRYLPGLEIHHRPGGKQHEVLDLEAGRNRVNWLHGADAPDHSLRYHLTDHLGSGTLELDEQAKVQSREAYYPFGGTAWEDHSDQSGAYKTIRYSGKERDATGLYYYGYRYFAPWLSRWINPDPAGAVDGLNLYCFLGNSPVGHVDVDGRMMEDNLEIPDDIDNFVGLVRGSSPPAVDEVDGPHSQDSSWSNLSFPEAAHPSELSFHLMVEKVFNSEVGSVHSAPIDMVNSSMNSSSLTVSPRSKRAYPCLECRKEFSNECNLTVHIRSHTGEKPFVCTIDGCGKKFSHSSNLTRHMKVHNRPGDITKREIVSLFVCPVEGCVKNFLKLSHITEHMRMHSGERPFVCTENGCNKAFLQTSHLKSHVRTHTGVKPYICSECGRGFAQSQSRDIHFWVHKPKDSCPSRECLATYSAPSSLKQHIKKTHPESQSRS